MHSRQPVCDLKREPTKVVCGRDEKCRPAKNWNYESSETDWRKLVSREGHRPDRHRLPNDTQRSQWPPPRAKWSCARNPRPQQLRRKDGCRSREGQRHEHGVVQLSRVPAVALAKHLIDEEGSARSITTGRNCRTDNRQNLPQGGPPNPMASVGQQRRRRSAPTASIRRWAEWSH